MIPARPTSILTVLTSRLSAATTLVLRALAATLQLGHLRPTSLGPRLRRRYLAALLATLSGVATLLLSTVGTGFPAETAATAAMAERAWQLRSEGAYEEAADLYLQAASQSSAADRAVAGLAAAEAFLAARNYGRAIELATRMADEQLAAADAHLIRALALQGLGRLDDADAALRVHMEVGPLAGYGAFLGGDLRWSRGDMAGARDWYTWALDLGLAPLWEVAARWRVAETFEREEVYPAAAAWYERAARRAVQVDAMGLPVWYDGELSRRASAARPADLLLRAANAHRSGGALGEAAEVYWELASRYPSASQSLAALDALAELGQYYSVEPYYRGRVLLQAGRPAEAMVALSKAAAGEGTSSNESAVAYYAALAWRDAGDPLRAMQELAEMARWHPSSPLAPEALWQVARMSETRMGRAQARSAYVAVADQFPSSSRAAQALQRAGWLALQDGDAASARALWRRLGTDHPDPSARAEGLFWLGRGLLGLGDVSGGIATLADAEQAAPRSFEGLRARDLRLGGLGTEPYSTAGRVSMAQPDVADFEACSTWMATWASSAGGPPGSVFLERIDRLVGVGMTGAAQAEALGAIAILGPTHLHELAHALNARRLYPVSMAAASRLAAMSPTRSVDSAPHCLRRLAYPLAYAELVEREAARYGLDPYLVLALMRQESWFGPGARSGAEALGLSQVIPATAVEIAQGLGRPGFRYEDLTRPREGVVFGSFYLNRQYQYLAQRPMLALAAYNAGPGSVQRWVGGNLRVDPDDFVQAIDYAETRTYVRSIYEIYNKYRELYG